MGTISNNVNTFYYGLFVLNTNPSDNTDYMSGGVDAVNRTGID